MLGYIRRLFGGPDRLTRLARGADRKAFADAFLRADLWFLSIPPGLEGGLEPARLTEEALLGQIEAAARDTSERAEFLPFTYEQDGTRCLPLFSTQALATEFVTHYVRRRNRVIPFAVLQTNGLTAAATFAAGATVVLNDGTKSATRLSADDLRQIREAAGPRQPPA